MVTIFSDTRGVTGQTVNYFCPFLKGAEFPIRKLLTLSPGDYTPLGS